MALPPFEAFLTDHGQAILRLYSRARPERWQVSELDFAAVLYRSATARFSSQAAATTAEVDGYLDTLFAEELALACACERGHEPAWLDFLERFRSILLGAARDLAGAEQRARDLADGIYADLYGLEECDGKRRSLFAYFHGRSSLATWLRSVLTRSDQSLPAGEECPHAGFLAAYYEQKLDPVEAEAVDRHLAGCSACQQLMAALARLDPTPTAEAAPPEHLPLPEPAEEHRGSGWKWVAAAIVLAATALVAVMLSRP
jgi:hypothetical protein